MNSIENFLAAKTYAVAGASNRQHKYGYKVFHALLAAGRETYPLNPIQEEIEGHQAYPPIADLPLVPEALSIITPPDVTRQVVADAITAGVKHIWMNPEPKTIRPANPQEKRASTSSTTEAAFSFCWLADHEATPS